MSGSAVGKHDGIPVVWGVIWHLQQNNMEPNISISLSISTRIAALISNFSEKFSQCWNSNRREVLMTLHQPQVTNIYWQRKVKCRILSKMEFFGISNQSSFRESEVRKCRTLRQSLLLSHHHPSQCGLRASVTLYMINYSCSVVRIWMFWETSHDWKAGFT